MTTSRSMPSYRFGVHMHLYLWSAVILFSLAVPLFLAVLMFRREEFGLYVFLGLVVLFQVLFWFACRRCASPELGVWKGLLYVTGYMTVGIGLLSMLVAIPAAIAAIFCTVGIAVGSLFESDTSVAQKRFVTMVKWFQHRRMYQ